jgi:transposase-like protein
MAVKAKVGFGVTCPLCGEADTITLDLNDLRELNCASCDETFTVETALTRLREELTKWEAINEVIKLAEQRASQS